MDSGQPPSISAAGLRSNLFVTQSIIPHKKQAEFKGFKKQTTKSRRQYNLFLENYPAFKGLIIAYVTTGEWRQQGVGHRGQSSHPPLLHVQPEHPQSGPAVEEHAPARGI